MKKILHTPSKADSEPKNQISSKTQASQSHHAQEKPKPEEAPAATAVLEEDPLSKWLKIEGVGKKNAEKLVKAGILDIKEILEGDLKALSKKSKVSDKDLKKIVESFQKKAPK